MAEEWKRTTVLRQGALLSRQELNGGVEAGSGWEFAVVVSHDCDIANDVLELEPNIELMPVFQIETPDGNKKGGKNPRELHLCLVGLDGNEMGWYSLTASSRLVVAKRELSPDGPISGWVDPEQLHELQDWLAARFRRHALPDTLMSRLSGSIKDLERRLRKKGREIIGIWLGYEPREELDVDEPYEIDLYVVFSVEIEDAESVAQDLIARLRSQLEDAEGVVVVAT